MMMQTEDTMTFSEAISILDEFVDRMGWLATPAHGSLPDKALCAVSVLKEQAAEAARTLEYLKEVKERAAQLLILEEEHVKDAIKMAWRGLRFPEEWDRVNRSVTGVQRCLEFIKELARFEGEQFEGEEPVTGSEHGRD